MKLFKLQLVRLRRLVSASSAIWDMIDYNKAKLNTDIGISFLVSVLTLFSVNNIAYPKISNPYAQEFYKTAVVVGYVILFHAMVRFCRVFRFLHCLICGGGWTLLAATDLRNLGIHEPLINKDLFSARDAQLVFPRSSASLPSNLPSSCLREIRSSLELVFAMENNKPQLVKLGRRIISALRKIWDMIGYNKEKSEMDAFFSVGTANLIVILVGCFTFPKISDPDVRELYGGALMGVWVLVLSVILLLCRVFRFLRCLICGGGWTLLAATKPVDLVI